MNKTKTRRLRGLRGKMWRLSGEALKKQKGIKQNINKVKGYWLGYAK